MNANAADGKAILDCLMHKLPWSRKYYQVRLVVPDTGSPFVEYRQVSNLIGARKTKTTPKIIRFTDLLFADKKHDTSEKCAFSIYSIDKTITFLAEDEGSMNEWLTRIRELHSKLYPEFKRYDSIFEAKLLDKGLATTLQLQGHYRLAVCKESLDLIPLLTGLPQDLPTHQRFVKRHPLLASKTIELVLRSIRRCGHTQANFYIESGRHSPIGQGDLWMGLSSKATARQLHELLLATMKLASAADDQYPFKAPRSRSGSSSDNTQHSQPSLVNHDNNNIDEDSGYLAMA